MQDTNDAAAIALLDDADFDPIVANEIMDCVLDGYRDDALEKIADEMGVTEEHAEAVYGYLARHLRGTDLALEEVTVDVVPFVRATDMQTSGNPFMARHFYFARRGLRVLAAYPYKDAKGVDGFNIGGIFHAATAVDQLWRTTTASTFRGETE